MKIQILYPAIAMMILTLFLYVKNSLDNVKAIKTKAINFKYFKTYKGEVPDYVAVSRQTLKNQFERKGLIFSGMSPDNTLPEIIELKNHPWFIGVQFHPEFKSRPLSPHPLFSSFIKAAKSFHGK